MDINFSDIPSYGRWKTVTPVDKGWSSDKKFKIITDTNEAWLLRLSNIGMLEAKKKEYDVICKYSRLGIPMSQPIDHGICGGGRYVYMLLSWVEGADLEAVLPTLPEEEQYRLGIQAGEILKKIHSIPLTEEDMPGQTKAEKKLTQLERYLASDVRVDGDDIAAEFVRANIDAIWQEKPVYQHGDFHPGNLIYMPDGNIGVIDFNRWEVGDPWEEFLRLQSFGVEVSVPYCVGQIHGYFGGKAPESFWKALAVYVAQTSLYSILWAVPFGEAEVQGMVTRWRQACGHYEGFRRLIPTWYWEE